MIFYVPVTNPPQPVNPQTMSAYETTPPKKRGVYQVWNVYLGAGSGGMVQTGIMIVEKNIKKTKKLTPLTEEHNT